MNRADNREDAGEKNGERGDYESSADDLQSRGPHASMPLAGHIVCGDGDGDDVMVMMLMVTTLMLMMMMLECRSKKANSWASTTAVHPTVKKTLSGEKKKVRRMLTALMLGHWL